MNLYSYAADSLAPSSDNTASLGATSKPSPGANTLRVDWSDAGAGELYVGPLSPLGTVLGNGLIVMFPTNAASVDPSVVGTTTDYQATAYPFERKTFQYDGFHYAFYDSGGIVAASSPDGMTWTTMSGLGTGSINPGFDTDQRGSTVVVAWIDSGQAALYATEGTMNKGVIDWGATATVATVSPTASPVGVAIGTDGIVWVSVVYPSSGTYSRWLYASTDPTAFSFQLQRKDYAIANDANEAVKPIPEPSGEMVFLATHYNSLKLWWSLWYAGSFSTWQGTSIDLAAYPGGLADSFTWFSATTVSNGTVWLIYASSTGINYLSLTITGKDQNDNPIFSSSSGSIAANPAGGTLEYPSVGVDAHDDLYIFWSEYISTAQTYYVFYEIRTAFGWTSSAQLFSTSQLNSAAYLTGSSLASDMALLLWTQEQSSGSYLASFVAAPLPTDLGTNAGTPWSRDGMVPGGTYYSDRDENVAPGSGLLTVLQTDLDLPGRGLDLKVSRIHTTPRVFLSSGGVDIPYLYDTYTGANLGKGWALDFPWIGPDYLHLWNAQTYVVTWNATGVFENHGGTSFRLVRSACGSATCARLTLSSGTAYSFDATGRLTTITDATGVNSITFTYSGSACPSGQLCSITDTVNRAISFGYTNGQLTSITCPGRSVRYQYDPQGSLANVTDPLGRVTSFSYNGANPYLISSVTYPAGGMVAYGYGSASVPSEATTYLVTLQNVYNGSALVKSTSFSPHLVNGRVAYDEATISNGTAVQGATVYTFGSPVNGMTTTVKDSNGAQLRRIVAWYTLQGATTQQDFYNGNVSTKTYSTYEALDSWGNVIYTRDAVGQESFSSFANTDSANAFHAPGRLSTTASGRIMSSNFDNYSLSDWHVVRLNVALDDGADPTNAPSMNVSAYGAYAFAYHPFASQSTGFVAEARCRPDAFASTGSAGYLVLETAGGLAVAEVGFLGTGTIAWYDGGSWHSFQSYALHHWYRIDLDVSVSSGTYNIWIDGVESLAGVALIRSGGINALGVGSSQSATVPTTLHWDDFKVFSSGTLSVTGLAPGTEVEALDARSGAVVGTTVVPAGSSAASLSTLTVRAHDYFVQVYNGTQVVRNGGMETSGGWSYTSTNPDFLDEGLGGSYSHSGSESYGISTETKSNSYNPGDYGAIYEDISGFPVNGTVHVWFKFVDTAAPPNNGCSPSLYSNFAFLSARLSVADFGGTSNLADLAIESVDVTNYPSPGFGGRDWTELTGAPGRSRFRLMLRVVADTYLASCTVQVYIDDVEAPPEYASPSADFWGGDVDAYSGPIWRSGEFYSNSVPPAIHDHAVGLLRWQNGSLDPVLYYDMQTTETSRPDLMKDLSGHGNDGAISGTTTVTGFAGGARSFNGVSDFVQAPDTMSLDVTPNIGVPVWVYLTANPDCDANNNWRVILTKMSSAGSDWGSYFVFLEENRAVSWTVSVGGVFQRLFTVAGVVPINQWVHLAFVRNSAGYMAVYVNGALSTSTTNAAGSMDTTAGPLRIGAGTNLVSCPNGDGAFPGIIDEVKVFNHALSTVEVSQLATQTLWFDMETVSPSGALKDMSGYQNGGTVNAWTLTGGKVGEALSFNGAYTYVLVPESVSLEPPQLTLTAWINTNSLGTTQTIVDNSYPAASPSDVGYVLAVQTNGSVSLSIYNGGRTAPYTAYTFPITTGTWYYVAATYDGNYIQLYINGVVSGEIVISPPPSYSASVKDLVVGTCYGIWNSGVPCRSFSGVIDEVHVYRRALSANELTAQNGAKSTPPSRIFLQYNSLGENTETRTYHNGSWLYTDWTFDAYGNVVSQTDPNGQVTQYAYSSQYGSAYLTSVARGSSTETFTYDFNTGAVSSATDPRGFRTTYTYDPIGRPLSVIQPAVGGSNPSTFYAYDDAHDIVTAYDADSMPRIFHEDMETLFNGTMEDLSGHGAFGSLYGTASVAGKVGLARSFNGTGARIQAANVNVGATFSVSLWVNPTRGQADGEGVLVKEDNTFSITLTSSRVVNAYIYNGASWQVVSSNSSLSAGSWTHVAVTYAKSGSNTAVYVYLNSAKSNAKTLTGTAQVSSNRLMLGALSATSQRFYGSLDEAQLFNVSLTSSQITSLYQGTQGGRYVKTYYDGLGRKVRAVQRSFFSGPSTSGYRQESYAETWQDQVARYVNANGSTYATTYDFLGRATAVTNPDGSTRTTSYDDINRVVTETDEVGHVTQDLYDLAGRLASVRQYNSTSVHFATTYAYDLSGELVAVADPLGQTTRRVYDDAGRLAQTLYPDGTNETYTYDNVGNLLSKTDRGGRTVRDAYDGLYHLATVTYPGGAPLRLGYDPDGDVVSVRNGTASIWFTYDALDRVTNRSLVVSGDSTNYTTSYGLDAAGNVVSMTYPDGQGTLTYSYDAFYRATSLKFGSTTVASLTYRKDDLLGTIAYGDGTSASYVFNGRGFPLEIKVASGSTSLLDLWYTENATGQVTGITNKAATGDTERYVYDGLDRLLTANGPWGTLSYAYDAAGNRLAMSLGSATTTYKYGAYDKLCASGTSASITCASSPSSTVTKYSYDANGNIVNRVSSANASYTFDLDNRLVKACTSSPCSGTNTYTFAYDGLGDRIRETGPSGTTAYNNTYVASGGAMLYLKSVVGTATTKTAYVYAGSLLVASVSGATYSYFHEDHLGSVRLVTQKVKSSVTTVFATNYEPFGVQYGASGTDPSVKYTEQWTEALGLVYDHARYYDPSMGRFVSMDSVLGHVSNPQTLNRYAYVEDSPERYADPGGHGHGGQGDGGGQQSYADWWGNPPEAWWRGLYPIASCTYSKGGSTCEITVQGHLEILPSWAYQIAFIGLGVLLTAATAGAALPWILGLGLAGGFAGMGVYAGYEWATGGAITTEGLLYAFGIGFAVGAVVGGLAEIASDFASRLPLIYARVYGDVGASTLEGASKTGLLDIFEAVVRGGIRNYLGLGEWNVADQLAIGLARPGLEDLEVLAAQPVTEVLSSGAEVTLEGGAREVVINDAMMKWIWTDVPIPRFMQ